LSDLVNLDPDEEVVAENNADSYVDNKNEPDDNKINTDNDE